jgi:hypothetical protein
MIPALGVRLRPACARTSSRSASCIRSTSRRSSRGGSSDRPFARVESHAAGAARRSRSEPQVMALTISRRSRAGRPPRLGGWHQWGESYPFSISEIGGVAGARRWGHGRLEVGKQTEAILAAPATRPTQFSNCSPHRDSVDPSPLRLLPTSHSAPVWWRMDERRAVRRGPGDRWTDELRTTRERARIQVTGSTPLLKVATNRGNAHTEDGGSLAWVMPASMAATISRRKLTG